MSTLGRTRVSLPLSSFLTWSDVRWLVVEIDDEAQKARVVPYLDAGALARALDEAVGSSAWANRYLSLGEAAVGCELQIEGLAKSAVAGARSTPADSETLAAAALTRATAMHGASLPVDVQQDAWVDWDPDQRQVLYWPEAPSPSPASEVEEAPAAVVSPDLVKTPSSEPSELSEPVEPSRPLGTPPDAPEQAPIRSEGQRAIDKLMDRLREAGLGLEAARLVNAHHGYGSDPDAARELYARLRQLLLDRSAP